jgi:hypothetical protein
MAPDEATKVEELVLSPELADALAAVYKPGGSASAISWPSAIAWTIIAALVVPTLSGSSVFLIPLGRASEQPTFLSQWRFQLIFGPLACLVGSPCAAVLCFAMLNTPATPRRVLRYACICSLSLPIQWAASVLWAFPVPMGAVWIDIIPSYMAELWLVHEVYGMRRVMNDKALKQQVNCRTDVDSLVMLFIVVFAFYRSLFASLEGDQQAAIAPLFALMKLGFKEVAIRRISQGGNPDAAPLTAFVFDLISGTTAQLLVRDR